VKGENLQPLSNAQKPVTMNKFWKTVLLTTLIAGTDDLIFAYVSQFVKTGKFADKMLYYIAGGGLGLETSMQGGFWIGLLGLFFHYFIAFSFTLLFFMAYPTLKFQRINKYWLFVIGMLYGPFVSCFMRYIVLPLSRLPAQKPLVIQKELLSWAIFGLVFSVPIAFMARMYYASKAKRLNN